MLTRLVFVNVAMFTLVMTLRLLKKLGAFDFESDSGVFGLATTWKAELLLMRPWSVLTHLFVHWILYHRPGLFFTTTCNTVLAKEFEFEHLDFS